jgi:hypothetical protein
MDDASDLATVKLDSALAAQRSAQLESLRRRAARSRPRLWIALSFTASGGLLFLLALLEGGVQIRRYGIALLIFGVGVLQLAAAAGGRRRAKEALSQELQFREAPPNNSLERSRDR